MGRGRLTKCDVRGQTLTY